MLRRGIILGDSLQVAATTCKQTASHYNSQVSSLTSLLLVASILVEEVWVAVKPTVKCFLSFQHRLPKL